jgi:hypothetical protein
MREMIRGLWDDSWYHCQLELALGEWSGAGDLPDPVPGACTDTWIVPGMIIDYWDHWVVDIMLYRASASRPAYQV